VDPRTGLPMPGASPKQRIIGRTMTAVERIRVDSETNLRDILDKVHEISIDHIDDKHFFTLSQVYEDLLLKMGEKNSDGGQFFTPREVIRAMVHTVDPKLGQTVYDPCCGTGGFLAIAYEHIARKLGAQARSTDIDTLKHDTFFGREKDKAARELEARAAAIDAAVFDLKAVNPNAVATVDERTPAEIIASIDAQGRIVTQALGRLRALLKADAQVG